MYGALYKTDRSINQSIKMEQWLLKVYAAMPPYTRWTLLSRLQQEKLKVAFLLCPQILRLDLHFGSIAARVGVVSKKTPPSVSVPQLLYLLDV